MYSVKSAACFAVLYYFHIPWTLILNKLGRKIFGLVEVGCYMADNVLLRPLTHEDITGSEQWVVHCHCERPGSLQCIAAGRVMCDLFEEYVFGTIYNDMFPSYRQYVNRGLPKFLHYVGSVYFRGKHFIYVAFQTRFQMQDCLKSISFGPHTCLSHSRHNMLIMCCMSCRRLTEIMACCCMRRTRLLLLKCVRHLLKLGNFNARNHEEKHRQRMLDRMRKYGMPFKFIHYVTCDFLD